MRQWSIFSGWLLAGAILPAILLPLLCGAQDTDATRVAAMSQHDKKSFATIQPADGGPHFMWKIDSVSRGSDASAPFGAIYSSVMKEIDLQLQSFDSAAANFIRKFERSFAGYFLDACEANRAGTLLPSSPWYNMFSNPGIHPIRLGVMGINTHVNADIWKTFVTNFDAAEIRRHKKAFLSCQRSITRIYSPLFEVVAKESWYVRLMRALTLGAVKKLGEGILYKWRVRQDQLALLYYKNPERFQKKLARVNRYKEQVDRMLISGLPLILPRK